MFKGDPHRGGRQSARGGGGGPGFGDVAHNTLGKTLRLRRGQRRNAMEGAVHAKRAAEQEFKEQRYDGKLKLMGMQRGRYMTQAIKTQARMDRIQRYFYGPVE